MIKYLHMLFNLLLLNEYFGFGQIIDNEAVRELSNGSLLKGRKITTESNATTYAFLGIPYAEAPISAMRYRGPMTSVQWSGVLDASYYKVACVFYSSNQNIMSKISLMSEDCLQLNVFVPKMCTKSSQCPVMMHVDSGLYDYGSAMIIRPDGMANIWANDGIVVVTLNFRMGSFGFLNALDENLAIKNAGMLDQIEALKWIQREIASFGGDPKQVTLVGIGLGAINVDQLSLSPLTNGLFHQLALLGGSASMIPHLNAFSNYLSTLKLGEMAHCTVSSLNRNDTPNMADIVNCLRAKKASELLQAQQAVEAESLAYNFKLPALDGDQKSSILPTTVIDLVQYRKGYNMLIGNVEGEVEWLTKTMHYKRSISLKFLCQILLQFRQLPVNGNNLEHCNQEYAEKQQRLLNDVAIYLPIYETAYYNTKNGGNTYLFEVEVSDRDLSDVSKIFDTTLDERPNNILYHSLQNFIKYGDPTTSMYKWPKYLIEQNNFASISSISPPVTKENYHISAILFWILGGLNQTRNEKTPDIDDESGMVQLKSLIAGLLQDLMEATKTLKSESAALQQQWISKMQNISKHLNNTINELLEAQKSESYQEFMKNYTSICKNCAPEQLLGSDSDGVSTTMNWQSPDEDYWKITTAKGSVARIDKLRNETWISIQLTMPASVIGLVDQVSRLLGEVFKTLEDGYSESIMIEIPNSTQYSKSRPSNSITPILKHSILQGLLATTISEGKLVKPTLATVIVRENWISDTWFWIGHIVGVIIIVILVIAVIALCLKGNKGNKRKDYETIS